jgi:hypothetical protein
MSAYDKYDNKRGLDDVYSGRHLLWTDMTDNVSPSWLTPYKHDASSQGQYLKQRQKTKVDLERIQKSSGDWVGARIEGFENAEKSVDDMIHAIRISQQQFDDIYAQYEVAYNKYVSTRQDRMNYMKQAQRYAGREVVDAQNRKYYVNKYGYARAIDDSQGIPSGCPKSDSVVIQLTKDNNDDFFNFIKLGHRQTGIPCDLEGKVVYKQVTIEGQPQNMYGWINEEGKLMPLPRDTQCNLMSAIKINEDLYDNMPTGNPLLKTDRCTILSDTSVSDIYALNKQLVDAADKIERQLEDLSKSEADYGNTALKNSRDLIAKRTALAQHRQKMGERLTSIHRLEGEITDNNALYRSEYLKYMGLSGIAVGLGGYLLYKLVS